MMYGGDDPNDEYRCPRCGAWLDDGYYGHNCPAEKSETSRSDLGKDITLTALTDLADSSMTPEEIAAKVVQMRAARKL